MPVKIHYYASDHLANVTVVSSGDEHVLKQTFPHGVSMSFEDWVHVERGHHRADAYAIREAFFDIATLADAVSFLERCGPFRTDVHETTFSDLQGWQTAFRDWLIGGYNCFPLPPVIELGDRENKRIGGGLSWHIATLTTSADSRPERVEAWVFCDSAVEAIGATIALDLIEGANFKSCLWCTKAFEVTKDNGRQYCTTACAHRAGQKRRRAEAKSLKDSRKPKRIKTKSKKRKV
jgi:hypothetical protein